jgi:hypothetical protein
MVMGSSMEPTLLSFFPDGVCALTEPVIASLKSHQNLPAPRHLPGRFSHDPGLSVSSLFAGGLKIEP